MSENAPHILASIHQFDNFITGPSNRMAYAAAKRVAEQPGRLYNPLVVHGGVGLGKTHLLQALGNAVSAAHPDWKVVMLSGGQIRRQDLDGAERAELLLIDDLHLGILEREVQIRMIPLFDAMVGTGRQIAATTDVAPAKIEKLDPKLLSRLLGGVIVGLKEIDLNEKTLMLAKKAKARETDLSEEVLLTIASRVPANVRELEGALNRVMLYASLFDGQVTRAIVDEALPPTIAPTAEPVPAGEAAEPEAGAEPGAGEFGNFLTGLDTKVTDLITQEQDAEKLRHEYREKLYIWRMKGFNTARVERTLDQDIAVATREYQAFTDNIERLITIQEEFGGFYRQASQEEIAAIEALLFDPDRVEELQAAVEALKQRLASGPAEPVKSEAEPIPPTTQAFRLSQVIAPPAEPRPAPVPETAPSRAAAPQPPAAPPAPKQAGPRPGTDQEARPAAAPEPSPAPPKAQTAPAPAAPGPQAAPAPLVAQAPQPGTAAAAPVPEPAMAAAAPEKAEASPANLGLIEENWPRIEDRLMEDF